MPQIPPTLRLHRWLASLLTSLIAASFAILVKQWLREYLAVQNPSPQARLRVRHLRYPQLSIWKVFEIAGFLPLLLQLSLGLFFVGMCYFTTAIHSSIGNTTLPLVSGWAAFFAGVTLLPFMFPRCPYRTPLLKRLVDAWYRSIALAARRITFILEPDDDERILCLPSTAVLRQIQGFFNAVHGRIEAMDEVRVIVESKTDFAILASADAIQVNDDLLATTIFDALQQTSSPTDRRSFSPLSCEIDHKITATQMTASYLWVVSRCLRQPDRHL